MEIVLLGKKAPISQVYQSKLSGLVALVARTSLLWEQITAPAHGFGIRHNTARSGEIETSWVGGRSVEQCPLYPL